jgi:signal transduction histidine kinase
MMLTFLRRLARPPVFSNPEQNHLARLLHYVLIVGIVLAGVFAALTGPQASNVPGPKIAAVMTAVFAFLFLLLHAKHLYLVNYLLIGSSYLAIMVSLIFNGGLRDEAALVLMALLALTGFFLGEWPTVILGVVTAVAFIGLFAAERFGLIRETEHVNVVNADELMLVLIAILVNTLILRQIMGRLVANSRQIQQKNEALLITQQELLAAKEAADLANRAKSDFLSRLSHDLRTPLNSMIGFAGILRDDQSLTGAAHKDYLNRIQKNGEYMQQMINDLLDLSRIEAGKLQLYPVRIPLTAFLMEIVILLQMRVEQKSFQFVYQFDDNLPDFVVTDETRLRQILINLLENAIKFTPKGSVTFRVKRVAAESPVQPVRFEIADTGVGIPAADLQRIFDPFEQSGSGEQREKGTGLGLAISRHLVELLGGRLHVESRLGKGSRFWFDLPFSPDENLPD